MTIDALRDGETPGIFARTRNILIRPQSEWRRIAGEEPGSPIGAYVLPLALIGAAVSLGASVLYSGGALNAALVSAVTAALLYLIFALAGVWAAGIVINMLAQRFGAESNSGRARQLAAYSATPILVAMLASVAPPIAGAVIAVGVIYALVLLAMGTAPLLPMRDPSNNVPRFAISFVAVAGVTIVLVAVFVGPLIHSGREAISGAVATVAPPPVPQVLPQRAAAETAIARLSESDGALVLTDPARLEEQFPSSLPSGFQRQSVVTAKRGGIARADAVYRVQTATFHVAVIQFAADVEPTAFATLLAIKADGPQTDGYARTQVIDGRFYAEEVSGGMSRYIVIGHGVVMIAQGGVTMDQARAAVETIGLQRLEAMFGR